MSVFALGPQRALDVHVRTAFRTVFRSLSADGPEAHEEDVEAAGRHLPQAQATQFGDDHLGEDALVLVDRGRPIRPSSRRKVSH